MTEFSEFCLDVQEILQKKGNRNADRAAHYVGASPRIRETVLLHWEHYQTAQDVADFLEEQEREAYKASSIPEGGGPSRGHIRG